MDKDVTWIFPSAGASNVYWMLGDDKAELNTKDNTHLPFEMFNDSLSQDSPFRLSDIIMAQDEANSMRSQNAKNNLLFDLRWI